VRQTALRSNEALRSRSKRPEGRRGRTPSSSARGAKQTTHHGPLERVLEGLPLPPNKATQFTWHCLTARLRAAPTSNEAQRQTKPPSRMLPPAQRRNTSVRGGDCHRDTRAVHEAVQLSHGSYGPDRRGNEGLLQTGIGNGRWR